MPAEPLLRIEGVAKRFGPVAALDGLDLDVAPGEFLALLGGSGSGKSTLLRLVAGFETPDSGRILLRGEDLAGKPPQARDVGMVFQSYALFPHLSVFDNVAYGLRREGVARPEIARRVAEALAMVGLQGMERRMPHQLSGGQRQRVALVRSLAKRPSLLLLDEPLGALDAGLRERTGFELRALQRRTGAGFVMVTHDQAEALSLADRVAVLEGGRLVQCDAPRVLYDRPATRFVAEFLGGANLLEGRAGADGAVECPAVGCTLRLPGAAPPAGAAVSVAVRPERIGLLPATDAPRGANTAAGTLRELAYRGEAWVALVATAGGQVLRVVLPGGAAPPPPGDGVALAWEDGANVVLKE
ncbi:ABC transporter ATP-binding protein [Craurococcus roseus]|uniref:ABC transporter ATP-binding protein n=1 Tax=Craurococcus roseus TaxID=77585 RepID=A0ABP3PJZ9_9PROT